MYLLTCPLNKHFTLIQIGVLRIFQNFPSSGVISGTLEFFSTAATVSFNNSIFKMI